MVLYYKSKNILEKRGREIKNERKRKKIDADDIFIRLSGENRAKGFGDCSRKYSADNASGFDCGLRTFG